MARTSKSRGGRGVSQGITFFTLDEQATDAHVRQRRTILASP